MRRLLACLLVLACGCGDSNDSHGGQAGHAADSGVGGVGGTGGKSGSAANGGTGGMGGTSGKPAGGSGGQSSGGHGGSGPSTGMITLVPNVVSGKQTGSGAGTGGVGAQQSALRVGSPSATTLYSLKYYITSIQLCEYAEVMGTGYQNLSGCISLYQNMPAGSPDYNTYTVKEAQHEDMPGRYIDLMSADGQASLRKPVTLQTSIADPSVAYDQIGDDADGGVPETPKRVPGVYRYGLINFYRPIKVKAEFPIIGEPGNYFRTKAVKQIFETKEDNGMLMDTVEIGDTLSGDTEETTYMLNNGGALFVFQTPFVITQADVDAKAQIFIDLVFNPENFGQAYVTDCAHDLRVTVCDPQDGMNGVAIEMPYVRMSPVPRKQGQRTHKETYLVDYDDSSKVRIELYYNDADKEALIQGVDTALVYNTNAAPSLMSFNTIASNFVTQSGSVNQSNASVSLLDYRQLVNLEDLVRRTDGTVKIHCLFPGSLCPANETITRAYKYVDDRIVSGE